MTDLVLYLTAGVPDDRLGVIPATDENLVHGRVLAGAGGQRDVAVVARLYAERHRSTVHLPEMVLTVARALKQRLI